MTSMSSSFLIGASTGSIAKVGATALNIWYQLGEDAFEVEIIRPTWVTPGAASFRSCSHFPIREYSRLLKPVMLPFGRARLWTKPCPSGSETVANTIGMVRVSFL